jgi:hypothetical protein
MFKDLGGPLWLLIDVLAVVALGAAIAYGTMAWKRRRNPALEQVRDDATRKLFKEEGREKVG